MQKVLREEDPDFYKTLRQEVCDYIEEHNEQLDDLLREAIEVAYGSVDRFVAMMRRNGEQADGNVANIVSLMKNINIAIHTFDGKFETFPLAAQSDNSDVVDETYHIVYTANHWEATEPLDATALS